MQVHLKDSDDGDLYMLLFWTLPIVLVIKTRRFRDWICLRPQVNKIRGGGPVKNISFFKGPNRVGPLPLSY
jgi:hypothetical protein